jgi:hypothetical protein
VRPGGKEAEEEDVAVVVGAEVAQHEIQTAGLNLIDV